MDNENEYDLNYAMLYYIECKYVKGMVTNFVQAIMW